ncbi:MULTISPECIES: glutaredoxin family protein [Cellulomonas]|uniref:glutaredoxin family protein n=1 Tax=Cellulomonas TaxID=1707 RepID=UPI001B8EA7A1|nr:MULTISPECIES: glutaredoxin family protein [Cellulomonas]VTR78158.1 hypothetical protein CHMI_02934 [Cellulomonas hominis]
MPTTSDAPAPADRPPRVVLYGRAGCHLCADARAVVADVCAATGDSWAEVDVDAGGRTPDGRTLADAYGELVPVVEVDGARVGYWQIDAARVRDALAAGPTA